MEIVFPADEICGARGYGDVRGQPAKKWGTDGGTIPLGVGYDHFPKE
jgi:hypothetical protein